MALDEELVQEIQWLVVQGYANRERVFENVISNHDVVLDANTHALVREAIEHAFTQKTNEMASWPRLTDCDRLRTAFEALDAQGIVSLETAGLTPGDGVDAAAAVACARDESGRPETHGFCFFTWNDLYRAIDGEGLSLCFGTFNDAPETPAVVIEKCPRCKGRGWIEASKPSGFPSMCECQKKAPPPPVATPLTRCQKVGAAVLKACLDAGLDAEWDGASESFVELPAFRWQSRTISTQESDVRAFLESWELELRAGYTHLDAELSALEERAADWFETFHDFGPSLRERLRTHTTQFVTQEQARESRWLEATMNDRITAAFGELNQKGILASECNGLTLQDGWGYSGTAVKAHHRGVVFFHHEDVIDAVEGRGLFLAFGAISEGHWEDDIATFTLGREVVSVLQRHGIPSSWNNSVTERIRIAPFDWRRRRWTTAPQYVCVQSTEVASPQLIESRKNTGAPSCAIMVRALRDEGGFNLQRSKKLRAAWKAHRSTSEAHAGHLGLPHVFVMTGGLTSMMPQLATANLRDEVKELFLRGVRSRKE